MNDSQQNKAQEEFALTHIGEISQVWSLLKTTLQSVQQRVHSVLEQHPELTGVLHSKKASWYGLPTTILYNKDEKIEVALFARTSVSDHMTENDQLNIGKYIFIQVQVQTNDSELELKSFNENLAKRPFNQWYSKGVRYFRWPVNDLNLDSLTQELVETFKATNGLNL